MDMIALRRNALIHSMPHVMVATPGNPSQFTTKIAAPLKTLKVNFAPVQSGSGDPSPENIRPITGWTGCEVTRCGKNLIDPAQKTTTQTVARWYQADGYLLRAGKTYTLTSDISGTVYVMSKATATALSQGNGKTSYTPANDTLVYFQWYASSGAYTVMAMLTIDDTSPVFAPYTGTTYSVTFPTKASTVYGGYVDLVTGEVWKTWEYKDLGNLSFSNATYAGSSYVNEAGEGAYSGNNSSADTDESIPFMMMEQMNVVSRKIFNQKIGESGYYASVVPYRNALYIMSNDFIGKTATEIKTMVTGMKYAILLATPVLVATLTPQQITALVGANNIWSDANGHVEISYLTT